MTRRARRRLRRSDLIPLTTFEASDDFEVRLLEMALEDGNGIVRGKISDPVYINMSRGNSLEIQLGLTLSGDLGDPSVEFPCILLPYVKGRTYYWLKEKS